MEKPIIGVTPLWDEERESVWMLSDYMEAVQAAGGIPVILPLKVKKSEFKHLCESLDGILFTGGQDVDPSVYHAKRIKECGPASKLRDEMEVPLMREALEQDKPILAICRGHQLLNAVLNGSLYQDLKTEFPIAGDHNMEKPYDRTVHSVALVQDGPLAALYGKDELMVNSCHHQAVRCAAPDLTVMAWAEDGVDEACWCPGRRFVWSVQWHPERLFRKEPEQLQIFREFVKSCKKKA
jgi:putative glutamine amidotransferase